MFCVISIFSGVIATLAKQAHSRLPAALAGSTNRAYMAMFRMYLAFFTFNSLSINQVTVDVALAFLECLKYNAVTCSQMKNYVSAIRHFSQRFSVDCTSFSDPKISICLTSIQKNHPIVCYFAQPSRHTSLDKTGSRL